MDRQRALSVDQHSQSNSLDDAVALGPIQSAGPATPTTSIPTSLPTSNQESPSRDPARSPNPRLQRPQVRDNRLPSIRLRRLASSNSVLSQNTVAQDFANASNNNDAVVQANRRRSSSEPQRPQWDTVNFAPADTPGNRNSRPRGMSSPMPPLDEEAVREPGSASTPRLELNGDVPQEITGRPGLMNRASTAARSALGINAYNNYAQRSQQRRASRDDEQDEYEARLVDLLDVVDPEVATLSTLTNVQNSLFVPDLGRFLNRRPTYTLTRDPNAIPEAETPTPTDTLSGQPEMEENGERPTMERTISLSSHVSETEDHYAVLPHGITLKGWTPAEKEELNDHVRHMLHSRRAAFKRSMKGFGQYIRRPLGFLVTLYAFLITGFGLIWVLFLIGWISDNGKQQYVINIIDNILVALFAIVGDGLAPFRAIDTYHMIYIAHYHHLTWRLRKERQLPKLKDHNDLPIVKLDTPADTEVTPSSNGDGNVSPEEHEDNPIKEKLRKIKHPDDQPEEDPVVPREEQDHVLTPEQQLKLKHHSDKFARSHTFYKPHETTTHRAFSLRLLVAIVVILDCHSLFQIALGSVTWSMEDYHKRPIALTTTILCCSITCNITGGILISIGDKRSRKKDVVERMFRQQLTEQAMRKIEKRRQKERERNQALDQVLKADPNASAAAAPSAPHPLFHEERGQGLSSSSSSSPIHPSPENPTKPASLVEQPAKEITTAGAGAYLGKLKGIEE